MRPRPGGRGEAGGGKLKWASRSSFNAATTRRPWRDARPTPRRRTCIRGFNAATTRRPWRGCSFLGYSACGRASMRPRPGGRGEQPAVALEATPMAVLQCGHDPEAVENCTREDRLESPSASMRPRPGGRGEASAGTASTPASPGFNAATTRRPWRVRRRRPRPLQGPGLQCGHDPEAVERRRRAWRPRPSRASMRPRPGGRGEETRGRPPPLPGGGSMRPRPGGRGEHEQPPVVGHRSGLQCGHDPEAVESQHRR